MRLVKRLDEGFAINVRGKKYKSETEKDEAGKDKPKELSNDKKIRNELIQKIQENRKLLMYRNTEGSKIPELLAHIDDNSLEEDNND